MRGADDNRMQTAAYRMQIGRNLTDPIDGFLAEKKLLILDRDSKYSSAFQGLLKDAGLEVVRLPPRSPNLNAYAERFVIEPDDHSGSAFSAIECAQRLGGMLRFYHRAAA